MFSSLGLRLRENDHWSRTFSKLTRCDSLFNHQPIDFALEIYQDFTEEMWEFVRGMTFSFPWSKCKKSSVGDFNRCTDFSNQYHLMYLKDIQDLLDNVSSRDSLLLSWKHVLKSVYVEIERRID